MGTKKNHGKKKAVSFHPVIKMLTKAAHDLAPIIEAAEDKKIKLDRQTVDEGGSFRVFPRTEETDVRRLVVFIEIIKMDTREDVRYGVSLACHENTGLYRLVYTLQLLRRYSGQEWAFECHKGAGEPKPDSTIEKLLRHLAIAPGKGRTLNNDEAHRVAGELLREFEFRVVRPRLLAPPIFALES